MATNWKSLTVTPDTPLREVIAIIDRGAAQIALVADKEGHLLGTITDGDIRRALLQGRDFDSCAASVMHRECVTVSSNAERADVLATMRRLVVHQMPVVDETGVLAGLYLLDDLLAPKARENAVVIMAGGLGRRLRPLTEDRPKPMLPVGGKPVLETIIENFLDHGFSKFYLSVNYLGEQIRRYFGNGEKWRANIEYLEEEEQLGTGGALGLLPERPHVPFIVMNGDVLTRVDFGKLLSFHIDTGASATLCLRAYDYEVPYGVTHIDGHSVTAIVEKPITRHLINAGIYVLNPEVLEFVPPGNAIDMPSIVSHLIQAKRRVSAFPVHEYWLDIGRHEELERANAEFAGHFKS